MRLVLLTDGDGFPCAVDADYVCKMTHTESYPGVSTWIRFYNGYDVFVAETVEKAYAIMTKKKE